MKSITIAISLLLLIAFAVAVEERPASEQPGAGHLSEAEQEKQAEYADEEIRKQIAQTDEVLPPISDAEALEAQKGVVQEIAHLLLEYAGADDRAAWIAEQQTILEATSARLAEFKEKAAAGAALFKLHLEELHFKLEAAKAAFSRDNVLAIERVFQVAEFNLARLRLLAQSLQLAINTHTASLSEAQASHIAAVIAAINQIVPDELTKEQLEAYLSENQVEVENKLLPVARILFGLQRAENYLDLIEEQIAVVALKIKTAEAHLAERVAELQRAERWTRTISEFQQHVEDPAEFFEALKERIRAFLDAHHVEISEIEGSDGALRYRLLIKRIILASDSADQATRVELIKRVVKAILLDLAEVDDTSLTVRDLPQREITKPAGDNEEPRKRVEANPESDILDLEILLVDKTVVEVAADEVVEIDGGPTQEEREKIEEAVAEVIADSPEHTVNFADEFADREEQRGKIEEDLDSAGTTDEKIAATEEELTALRAKLAGFVADVKDRVAEYEAKVAEVTQKIREHIDAAVADETSIYDRAKAVFAAYQERLARLVASAEGARAAAILEAEALLAKALEIKVAYLKAIKEDSTVEATERPIYIARAAALLAQIHLRSELVERLASHIQDLQARVNNAKEELLSRLEDLKTEQFATVEEIRTQFKEKADELRERLQQRAVDFLEGATEAVVEIRGLIESVREDGTSVQEALQIIIHARRELGEDAAGSEEKLRKLVKALVISETLASDGDIVVEAYVEADNAQKRAEGVSSYVATIGSAAATTSSPSPAPTTPTNAGTSGTSTLVVGVLSIALPLITLL